MASGQNECTTEEYGVAFWYRCKTCGGSGLAYCSRCLGTGEYRYLMGFHFMKKDEDEAQKNMKVRDVLRARKRAEDLLPNDEIS
ncbi:putative Heat shock protein DnaJ, cysteine-rich domain superfamily [Helianthus annuus]|nr:putative Heat shock protein DnaJ, cysteine-rich domain superfamily [Helianthus annuus]